MKGNKDMGECDMKDMKCMMCEDHGFMVKSKDEKEVMEMGKMHMKNIHKTKATDKDIKESMKACQMEMKKWV